MNVLQALYNSEINCSIESMWDAGWTFKLGDHYNGYSKEEATFYSLDEGIQWLKQQAFKEYPGSKFTQDNAPELFKPELSHHLEADTQGTDLQSLDSEANSRQAEAQSGAGEKGRL